MTSSGRPSSNASSAGAQQALGGRAGGLLAELGGPLDCRERDPPWAPRR